jgi:hypothetical protein
MEFSKRELEVVRFALTFTVGDFVLSGVGWGNLVEEMKNIVMKIKEEKT